MISYYGSKSKLVDLYPEPIHDKIIEPFAGSARYSLKYWDRDILLIDKYEPIIKMWHWLQQATEKDLDNLPVLKQGESLSDFKLSEGERLFLSFIVSNGVSSPRNTVTKRAAPDIKYKIQTTKDILNKIKHWDIRLGDYSDIDNCEATWFIDPPYFNGGEHYPKGSKYIDYKELANWCKSRQGQVIVCENDSANWLPFTHLKEYWGGIKRSNEVIYYQV